MARCHCQRGPMSILSFYFHSSCDIILVIPFVSTSFVMSEVARDSVLSADTNAYRPIAKFLYNTYLNLLKSCLLLLFLIQFFFFFMLYYLSCYQLEYPPIPQLKYTYYANSIRTNSALALLIIAFASLFHSWRI